jgi:hypothetical protein
MVESEDCEEGGGGRERLLLVVVGTGDVGEATASSSSGLAMRSPPSDWDKLRSPFMLMMAACNVSGEQAAVQQQCKSERLAEAALHYCRLR